MTNDFLRLQGILQSYVAAFGIAVLDQRNASSRDSLQANLARFLSSVAMAKEFDELSSLVCVLYEEFLACNLWLPGELKPAWLQFRVIYEGAQYQYLQTMRWGSFCHYIPSKFNPQQ